VSVLTAASSAIMASAPAGATVNPNGVHPADSVAYPFTCRVISLGVGQSTQSTTLTVTATVPTTAEVGTDEWLTDVSVGIGPDFAGQFVEDLRLTVSSDGGTLPASQTTPDLIGMVIGPGGSTSNSTSLPFGVVAPPGAQAAITFRPTSITFDIPNSVIWDPPTFYLCSPTSDTALGSSATDDPLSGQISTVASDIQLRNAQVSPTWLAAHQALLQQAEDLLDGPAGAAQLIGQDHVLAAQALASSVRDLHIAALSGAPTYDHDATSLDQVLNELANRTLFIGGLVSTCGTSPPSCSTTPLTAYQSAAARRDAGVTFEQQGLLVAAANQYVASVMAGALLGG
jgi:hypothetical protein